MHTGYTIAPAMSPLATLNRRANPHTPAVTRDRRRRLLQVLAGPANTPSLHRPRRTARHHQSTGPVPHAEHR